jgi:hypothetical protein
VRDVRDAAWLIPELVHHLVRFGLALAGGRLLHGSWCDSAFADVPLRITGEPTGRSLGGWVLDPEGGHLARMLGSTWNGSFGVALDSRDGIVVAIASNIEFDQPAELMGELVELVRRTAGGMSP